MKTTREVACLVVYLDKLLEKDKYLVLLNYINFPRTNFTHPPTHDI
jgi:hypothetical protein